MRITLELDVDEVAWVDQLGPALGGDVAADVQRWATVMVTDQLGSLGLLRARPCAELASAPAPEDPQDPVPLYVPTPRGPHHADRGTGGR